MIIKNATYLNKDFKLSTGTIQVKAGKILLNPVKEVKATVDEEIFDAAGFIIIPGLINAHYHNGSLLTKGLSKEIPIHKWGGDSLQGALQQTVFDYLDEGLTEEEYQTVCLKGYVDLVKNGITFVSDSGLSDRSPQYFVDAMQLLGIQGVLDVEDLLGDFINRGISNVIFTGHLPEEEYINEDTLRQARGFIDKFDPYMMTHCLENAWRKELIYERFGKSTVQIFNEEGLLNEKSVLFHCVELSAQDISMIADIGSSIVHCPTSNMAGGGMANIKDCLRNNINVAIGTDWARYDIWEAMKLAYFLLKVGTPREEFSAEHVFKMATQNGAKAFGRENQIGSIDEGFDADLVFLKICDSTLFPLIDHDDFSTIVHNLMFETRAETIQNVMVKGKWIMKARKIVTIDENELNSKYEQIFYKIFGQYHL
jgi:5-methylthioadenosine/S-adenosylhomocysteine deaminase